jgi:hypothetical protein
MKEDARVTRGRWSLLFSIVILASWFCTGQSTLAKPQNGGCAECHVCNNPTTVDPCLRDCPRPRTSKQEIAIGPDEIVINEIEWEYEGVVFAHKLHAGMTAVGKGCQSCHHFQEAGGITSCKNCHPAEVTDEKLEQPGLKGAYHRQCLGCHQEWSHTTECDVCHAKKAEPAGPQVGHYPPRQIQPFGNLQEPVKKVWQSTYGGGTVVTLHHRNHTEKYGAECSACHHAEGCGACHGKKETTTSVRHSEEALHAICNQCHAEMSCEQCHLKQEAAEFSHDRTGWPLGKRHAAIACRRCHGDPNHFTKPTPNCNSCHGKWDLTSFDHKRTGLVLSENHREAECTECHLHRDFAAKPSCANCHEADVAFPAMQPGEYLK